MNRNAANKTIIFFLVFGISAIFLAMIRHFIMSIILAGIFSALAYPLYQKVYRWFGKRPALSSLTIVLIIFFVIIIPLSILLGIVTAEAINIGQSVKPWVQEQLANEEIYSGYLKHTPLVDFLKSYEEPLFQKAAQLIGKASDFLIKSVSSAAIGTANFIFMLFIMLYSMFYFLMEGPDLLSKIFVYLPIEDEDKERLLEKFVSVSRATIRGTVVIGILQGGLAGLAFAFAGINGAVFWGTIMTLLSIIPAVGSGLVWLPASLILLIKGSYIKGFSLMVFCGLLVGSLDNVLRPRLVGRDTMMHDLMILFSTLGGLGLFGILGFIIGPIVAALFITVWEIYGEMFKEGSPKENIG